MTEITYEQLRKVLHRPIAFFPIFAKIAGSATAGLMLSQAWYWSTKDEIEAKDGWFFKSQEEWFQETALKRPEQETARAALIKRGLLQEKRAGQPARLFFKLNKEILIKAINNPDEFCQRFQAPSRKDQTIKARQALSKKRKVSESHQTADKIAMKQQSRLLRNSKQEVSAENSNLDCYNVADKIAMKQQSENPQVVDCLHARARVPDPEETTTETTRKEDVVAATPTDDALKKSLLDLLEFEPKIMTKADWRNFHQLLKSLKGLNATAESVATFKAWFYPEHWKGRNGEKPSIKDVRENWATAFLPLKPKIKKESSYESKGDRNARLLEEHYRAIQTDPFYGNNNPIEISPRLLGADDGESDEIDDRLLGAGIGPHTR